MPTGGTEQLTKFFDELLTFKPAEKSEEIIHAETLRQLNNLVELRRARLANVTAGIPAVLWWVVAIGAIVNIILILMFDVEIHVHFVIAIFLFQHKPSFDDQDLPHNRNDRGVAFLPHFRYRIDPPTYRNRLDLDPLTRQVFINQRLALMRGCRDAHASSFERFLCDRKLLGQKL